jgi:predicted chitinase
LTQDWDGLEDGTLCRDFSPYPGIIGQSGAIPEDVNAPKILSADDILKIAPKAGSQAATIAAALNKATTDAGITTRIGQSMLIAQCAHESGGFVGDVYVEQFVESRVVFNPGAKIDAKFKVHAVQTNRLERYLQGHNVALWRISQAKFAKAKADYEKANPGKQFAALTGDPAWKPVALTDYVPGDVELPYWKLWYDPTSPHDGRSQMARDNGNVDAGDGLKYIGRGLIQLTWRSNYQAAGLALSLDLEKTPAAAAELGNAIRIAAWFWKSRSLNKYTSKGTDENFKRVTRGINPGLAGLPDRLDYYKKAKAALGINEL